MEDSSDKNREGSPELKDIDADHNSDSKLESPVKQQLLEAIEILKKQKDQALRDIDQLMRAKRDAVADPTVFVARLKSNSLPKMPGRQLVQPLPSIDPRPSPSGAQKRRRADASLAASVGSPFRTGRTASIVAAARIKDQEGRARLQASASGTPQRRTASGQSPVSKPAPPVNGKPIVLAASSDQAPAGTATQCSEDDGQMSEGRSSPPIPPGAKVRGRPFDEKKPRTFNKLWTREEQERLEALLLEYPDEPVATHRWAKIALALGNRTTKQVASRVQKFFIKLALTNRAMPGGGKPPNIQLYMKQPKPDRPAVEGNNKKKRRRENDSYYRPPPVYMSDEEEPLEEADLAGLDDELKNSEEYKELLRLQKLQRLNERKNESVVQVVHYDYRCDFCGMDPIVGPRFTCADCPADNQLDLCEECVGADFETSQHLKSHRFNRINEAAESAPFYKDDDYSWSDNEQHQYLNPNFLTS